jgi:hypothetical protein
LKDVLFTTETAAQEAIQKYGFYPSHKGWEDYYRVVRDFASSKEKTMSKKKTEAFDEFPSTIYIVQHEDGDDNPGYFLAFDDEVEAAEDAEDNGSQVATYELISSGLARVAKEVIYE